MIDARVSALVVLARFLVATLQGCGSGSSPSPPPPPASSCFQEVAIVGMAYNVSCNRTQTNIEAVGSQFEYFIGKGGLVKFTYKINDDNSFATQSAADIAKHDKGYILTLHPVVSKLKRSICVSVATDDSGVPNLVGLRNDFECPACSSTTDWYFAYMLLMQSMSSGVPCPGNTAATTINVTDVDMATTADNVTAVTVV
eukprot:TRINITY_DN106185_c0_g1_i1.p1 TRINITY_DN106185_c0_g1~~TRINITY_DN106185_c0_g1_i1.p1  ORF type:complete len:199 (+),score=28.09 TRINITY_DN106185_c0_g1_i1:153-749(+)